MSDKEFMQQAIKEALKSEEPLKCGVVIVKNNNLIAKAYNSQRKDTNITAHAKIKAIIKAGKYFKNKNLIGCTVYSTCEPCIMCLAAFMFAKVKKIVYGVSLDKLSSTIISITSEEFILKAQYKVTIVKNFMEKDCEEKLYSDHITAVSKFNK